MDYTYSLKKKFIHAEIQRKSNKNRIVIYTNLQLVLIPAKIIELII